MKKHLLTVFAGMMTALFAGAPVAQAVDVVMGGEFLTRAEVRNHDANTNSGMQEFIGSRVRLNANVNIDDRNSAFVQLQSRRIWGNGDGSASTGYTPGGSAVLGSGTGASGADDTAADVGLHQGYFTMRKFFNLPVDVQVGRQELVLDGHRIVGNTFWTLGANTHDAVKISHSEGNHSLMYFYSLNTQNGTTSQQNDLNYKTHIFHGQLRNVLGGAFSGIYVYQNDNTTYTPGDFVAGTSAWKDRTGANNDIHTMGVRQAGAIDQLWGIEYRGEAYYQTGSTACTTAVAATACGSQPGRIAIGRDAYMYGLRLGKQFKDVAWKPKATVWYDYLSGDGNSKDGTNHAFNTVLDTGHKYYGLMDLFTGVGTGAGTSAGGVGGTGWRGLRDFAAKFQVSPFAKFQANMDVHAFWTAQDANRAGGAPSTNTGTSIVTGNGNGTNLTGARQGRVLSDSTHLGEEVDLTLTYSYTQNILLTAGYSHFFSDNLMQALQGNSTTLAGVATTAARGQDLDWAYFMVNVHF
jgi:hypothetical protein